MGWMDKLKQAARGKSEMVEKGVDTAVNQVSKRTKGKYDDKLTKGAEQVKAKARSLDEERSARPPDATPPPPPTPPPAPSPPTPPPAGSGPA